MLLFLSSHRDFDKMMEKFVPAKDLPAIRDAVFTLKTKVCLCDETMSSLVMSSDGSGFSVDLCVSGFG